MKTMLRVFAGVAATTNFIPATEARSLSFRDRVEAQEAIERIYYSHQIGATKSFEEAVPRSRLEEKVATYLKQSGAHVSVSGSHKPPVPSPGPLKGCLTAPVERLSGQRRGD
jgi:hypothetical protein